MAQRITDRLAALSPERSWFSLEFFPPKTAAGFENLHSRITRLAKLQPLFVTVTWGAGGSTATKSLELAEICQRQYGLTTCLHLTCTNMNRRVLDTALAKCKEIGVRNVLALRGDEPRVEEYGLLQGGMNGHLQEEEGEEEQFKYAVDLVQYIRKKHGDWFCIGVAGYPEGHATSQWSPTQSPQHDLPYLRSKTEAGADFIMTQLFYDVDAFLNWQSMLRQDESGLFKDIPIVPGLMPVQSWSILTRTTKLSCAKVPQGMMTRFAAVKEDDELVKNQGIREVQDIVEKIQGNKQMHTLPQGYHFYTLNLEKAVAQILEQADLVPQSMYAENEEDSAAQTTNGVAPPVSEDGHLATLDSAAAARRRRQSFKNSEPRNRVVVEEPHDSGTSGSVFETSAHDAGVLGEATQSKASALTTAEGQGSLGREATWDDYPNGRFGDARSPAYGTIDGYGPTLHVSQAKALSIWGTPTSTADVTRLFQRCLNGTLSGLPWSEDELSSETELIRPKLLQMNDRGWWSIASQPAVNCAPSSDPIVGWGPRVGGRVWQRPFVEFFLPQADWRSLRTKLDLTTGEVIYFAGDGKGAFESNDEASVNPVTWGTFKGKEIITPTIIEAVSFRAWQNEAFALWREWQRIYAPGSESSKLLAKTAGDVWLVNIISHEYMDGGTRLWELLLGDW